MGIGGRLGAVLWLADCNGRIYFLGHVCFAYV